MAESWLKSFWETDIPALCPKLTDGLVTNDSLVSGCDGGEVGVFNGWATYRLARQALDTLEWHPQRWLAWPTSFPSVRDVE